MTLSQFFTSRPLESLWDQFEDGTNYIEIFCERISVNYR